MTKKLISSFTLIITTVILCLCLGACQAESTTYTLKFLTSPAYGSNEYPYTIDLNKEEFTKSPQEFSPQIARTAMILSTAAYNSDVTIDNLETLGFSWNAKFNYSDEYDENAIGLVMSSQQVGDTTIMAIVMRGTYGKEWYSNFDIGEDIKTTLTHAGFNKAKEFALEKIKMYMVNYGIDKNHTKFLVTGHSRGAAVANLTAAALIDKYSEENVYAYTFATPNTTTNTDALNKKYSGIFNFVNPQDFIAYIPLESWGFTKYGTTITFPTEESDQNYKHKLKAASDYYEQYNREPLLTFENEDALNKFLNAAHEMSPTIDDYYNKKHEISGLNLSLFEYMNSIADLMNNENILTNGLIFIGSDGTVFEPVKNFLLSGVDKSADLTKLDFAETLIGYAHTPQTYMAWLNVYIENM